VPGKRLCYFTSQQLTVYRSGRGQLHREAAFDTNEKGAAEFSRYVSSAPDSLFYLLADVVEEDFFQENIPYVHGSDRRALLARKLAQRYRDISLAVPISLGSEIHAGRREERVLYTSFTNTQQFQPWLEVLRSRKAKVVGVFSVALVAPALGKRLGFKAARYVMVSLQQAGLRQSYIENGRIRFSRISRVNFADSRGIAQECVNESLRTHQYLLNSRILPREAPPLDVLVLAPGEDGDSYVEACVDSPKLHFHVQGFDKVAKGIGLKSVPSEALGEALFLHMLAESRPHEQLADSGLRHFFHLWQGRVGLLSAGAAVLGSCLLLAGVKFLDAYQVNQESAADHLQETRASEEYARLQARFPKTPTSTENLRSLAKNYRALLRQSASPGNMLAEISQAVTALPQVEIDRIDWEVGGSRFSARREASNATAGRPASVPAAQAGTAGAPVQAAEISGRLIVPQASDYRAVTALVSQFTDALRARPGFEVTRTQLPFDINAEKNLSGDIGVARREEVPQFSVAVTRRRGT
jgi:hypothetical protein